MKPTMSEELNQLRERYRSPDIRFPEDGNEEQERLADQMDQRLWSFMYGPGMQMFAERLDERVSSGLSFLKTIGDGTDEKLTALKSKHEIERELLKKSLSQTQNALWGMGGLFILGTGALATFMLWPKFRNLVEKRKKSKTSDKGQRQESEAANKEEGQKNYFKWKRDRTVLQTGMKW